MCHIVEVNGAVEGLVDEAVLHRLAQHVGCKIRNVYGKRGRPDLLERLSGLNQAARHSPWIVLVDLENDRDCPVDFYRNTLPHPAR